MTDEKRIGGKAVADRLTEDNRRRREELEGQGIIPTLAILRVGEKPGDLAYERGAVKRAERTGVRTRLVSFPDSASQEEVAEAIRHLNEDTEVHGVLLLRPLPAHMDEKSICELLAPDKDVDGITSGSMAGVFMDTDTGFPPCTAQACMEILDHIGMDLKGKRVTVMGRSLVIGKPVAMMAMKRHATVTVLHSRTTKEDFAKAGREADVVIAAMGRAKMVGPDQLGQGQIILDVGINDDGSGGLCGDVDYEAALPAAAGITPVPGGVGSVTTAVLMKHVIQAAEKKAVSQSD